MISTRRSEGSIEILKLTGRLDSSVTERIRAEVLQVIDQGHHRLLFELSDVDLIDSSGLGVFVAALRALRRHGGQLVLVGLNPQVRTVFQLTRLDRSVSIFNGVEEAKAALASPSASPSAG